MLKITEEISIDDIDEALTHFGNKLKDKYGARLTAKQKEIYWASINDLLDARNAIKQNVPVS